MQDNGVGGRKLGFGLGAKSKPTGKPARAPLAGFAQEEEEVKRRPLIPLDHDDDRVGGGEKEKGGGGGKPSGPSERQIALVNKIPKDKEALWAYPVDWGVVERHDIVRAKLRQWVTKKIREYLGEEEKTLIDFVCTKVANRCAPRDLLKELRMVLEDDADVFMVKLWRLLVYHVLEVTM